MDAFSEVLGSVSMTGAIFLDAEFTAPWGVRIPHACRVAELLAPGVEHIVSYHLVLGGDMSVYDEDGDETRVTAGEIVIMPYGDAHRLASGAPKDFVDSRLALRRFRRGDVVRFRYGGGGEPTHVICGFLACRQRATRLFLAGLPPIMRAPVRGDPTGNWIERSVCHLTAESDSQRPGRAALLSKMAEALFIEGLRRYMSAMPGGGKGWLAGARDPLVGRALALLHREPARRWSAEDLAQSVGSSRSVMADRFLDTLGESPMAYLARWRLHLAARSLETTQAAQLSLIQIASDVGYESQAAFTRAFKKEFDVPPAKYRRRQQSRHGV